MYIKKILLVIVFIGLALAAYFSFYVYNAMFKPNTAFNQVSVYITIPSHSKYEDVKKQLIPLLLNIESFDALASRKKYNENVKAGRFIIKNGMNNNDIINSIRSKNLPVKVSFNNQETLYDLAGRIGEQIEADSTSLINAMLNKTFLNKNNFNDETALSMYIPNSYEFFWNTSAEVFRDRMFKEYDKFWTSNRKEKAKILNLTQIQVCILASIVQKETVKLDERPRVAGVYLNRLNKKMALQADPTVIYAIKKSENNFKKIIKRVLYKHLETNSFYNTYKYAGLPPGPIAMPDVSAIDAVLNAEKHTYYYFVADVNNFGYHKFAKNLAQHNRNRQEYVAWISKQ